MKTAIIRRAFFLLLIPGIIFARSPRTASRALLLEQFPDAAAAYSLRPVSRTGYFNPILRVRRSSDNAERDAYWWELLDGTLTTWTGANDGFVRTWYDQSGNARHAEQTTAGNQPQIVDAGALVTDGGKPAIQFITNNQTRLVHVLPSTSQPVSSFLVGRRNDGFFFDSETRNIIGNTNESRDVFAGIWAPAPFETADLRLLYGFVAKGAASILSINADQNTLNPGSSGFGGQSAIGARFTQTPSNLQGLIQEILRYPDDRSATLNSIRSNINAAWGVY